MQIKDASGLTEGKTQVLYKGLPVGTLKGFTVSADLKHIDAKIEMLKQTREKITKDALFWVVRPEISLNRITGLDTLVKGSYFEIQPGISTELTDSFTALPEAPPISARVPGLHLTLATDYPVSLEAKSPVYFKKVQVGEIISNALQPDATIETKLLIYPEFTKHVSTASKFFISSGIQLSANLPKISVKIDPIMTILRGGVSFYTSVGGAKITDKKQKFHLYQSLEYAKRSDDIPIKLIFSVNHELTSGAEIDRTHDFFRFFY